jgi:serine/threonine-protein kinase
LSPQAIDRVLLSADQLSSALGVDVTNEPSGGVAGILAMSASSYGTSDHSTQVTPRSCVGIAFTGEHDVFSGTDSPDIKTQTFGSMYQTSAKGPYQLSQTAAVFSSDQAAQAFMSKSQTQWQACSKSEVQVNLGFENGRGFTTGTVQRDGDLITISMASPPGENSADACQQALGVKLNVVVEARACEVPDFPTNPGNGGDPDWAKSDAEHVAKAMLDNVVP